MDERTFGAVVTEIPDEVRVRLSGDLNGRADETLATAYERVVALGPRRVSLDFGQEADDQGDARAVDVADMAEVKAHPPRSQLDHTLVGGGERLVRAPIQVAAETHPNLIRDLRDIGSKGSLIHRSAPCVPSSGSPSGSTHRWSRPSNPPCS